MFFSDNSLEQLEVHGLQRPEDVLLAQHEAPAVLQADQRDPVGQPVQDGLYNRVVERPQAAPLEGRLVGFEGVADILDADLKLDPRVDLKDALQEVPVRRPVHRLIRL